MTYEIVLTKWRAAGLLAIICCLAGLLFFGGVLVGVGLWQPTKEEIRMAREYRSRPQPNPPGAVQAVTVAAVPPLPPPAAPVAPPAEPAPVPVPAAAEHSAAATPPPATPAAHDTPAAAAEPSPFVLQVGSFRDPKNAKQLQAELAGKGYQATVFNALDSEQRMWHVVRVGHYTDVASAASDAAKIGDKEQLQALIRRGDRL